MRKFLKTFVMTLIMTLSITSITFATNNAILRLQEKLRSLGIDNSYIGATVEYLQKVKVTDAQLESITKKVDQAKVLIGDEKDLSKLDFVIKEDLKDLAQEAGDILSLRLSFGRNEVGATTVTITEVNGKPILSLSATEITEVILESSGPNILEAFESAIEILASGDKDKFSPVSGTLNETSTNTASLILIGVSLIVLARVLFVSSKKVFS